MGNNRFNILFKNIAVPISEMAEMYEHSALFIENHLVDEDVVRAFSTLKKRLNKQLDNIR